MLLRGLYTFEPRPEDHNHTLAFSHNASLLFLGVLKKDPEWLQVADIMGRVGYVPKSFVEPHDHCTNPNLIQSFLVDAVVKARYHEFSSASSLERLRDHVREEPLIVRQRANEMRALFHHPPQLKLNSSNARRTTSEQHLDSRGFQRRNVLAGPRDMRRVGSESDLEIGRQPEKSTRPPKPRQYETEMDNDDYASDSSVRTAFEGDEHAKDRSSTSDHNLCRNFASPSPSLQAIKSSLVNVVQETSGLNPALSENLLAEVFQCMKDSTSKIPVPVESLLEKLTLSSLSSPVPGQAVSELERVMTSLAKLSRAGIKSGIRQPSGANGPPAEYHYLLKKLDQLRKALVDCDAVHTTQLLQLGQRSFSQDFAHLYSLESPSNVKERMLDIFLIILALDKKGRGPLLSSPLPIFLARDLIAQTGAQGKEPKLFLPLVNVLESLLSCGEPMPNTHFQILGTGFVNFILTEIESIFMSEGEHECDKIADDRFLSMVNLLLVYNLQFTHPSRENLVLKVLAEGRLRPRGFLTVLIELFNKAHDPIQSEPDGRDHTQQATFNPGSRLVFKMLSDICLCQRTASLFGSSDKKKLLQIITEGLLFNPAGSCRLGFAQVLDSLLPSLPSSFGLSDVRTALLSILLESDPLAVPEHELIRQMSSKFPALFSRSISKVKMSMDGTSSRDHHQNAYDGNDQSCLSS